MISTLSSNIRIPIPVGDEEVVLICRKPTTEEMNNFLSSRFVAKGRKVQQNFVEERVKLIDKILVNIENVGYENAQGEMVPLTAQTQLSDEDKAHAAALLGCKVGSWKDLINVNWKCAAAMRFEEPQTEDGGDGKN
jgi:hypothetical protein